MTISGSVDIVLVEDSPHDAELMIRALTKHKLANNLLHLKDGEEALRHLFGKETSVPRIVFLDLKLPKVDGIEVLRKLKEDPRTRTIPVVVLTSSRENQDVAECYRLGVNSYIVKPVEFESFVKAIGELGLYWMVLNQPPTAAAVA